MLESQKYYETLRSFLILEFFIHYFRITSWWSTLW